MKRAVIFAGLFTIVTVAGCGGSVEHEYIESPEFSGQRTRIHVKSHDEPSGGYRVVEGQPINLHIHTASGAVHLHRDHDWAGVNRSSDGEKAPQHKPAPGSLPQGNTCDYVLW